MVLDCSKIKRKKSEVMVGVLENRAISKKLNQRILYFLEDGKKTVTEVFIHCRIEQSVASQALKELRVSGFVEANRQGKNIYYSLLKKVLEYVE